MPVMLRRSSSGRVRDGTTTIVPIRVSTGFAVIGRRLPRFLTVDAVEGGSPSTVEGSGPDRHRGTYALSERRARLGLMSWSEAATDFTADGSLRDLYILGTDIDDWEQVYRFARDS